jgi:hypothetical protein
MSDISGGTPLTPAEQAVQEQWQSLRRIVDQAFRMLPGGPGQGEGPTQDDVDRVVRTVVFLYQTTIREYPQPRNAPTLYEWLGVGFGVDRVEAEVQAALAIRDLLLVVGDQSDPGGFSQADDDADAAQAERAAELFATIPEHPNP